MGDPKKAIIKLSGPMIAAMFLMSTYNIVNAIWVAGLGSDALAAVGFVTPLFMILMGLSNGLGAGVASLISRRIGAKDKTGADNAAVHGLLFVIILSAVFTVPLMLLTGPIVTLFGAGETAGLATQYGQIVFLGMALLLFTNIAYAILRAEGDAKRAMYVMGASSILNIILDPLLIYSAGMGIAGAAWGMIVSLMMTSAVLLYWFFVKRDTYVTISCRDSRMTERPSGTSSVLASRQVLNSSSCRSSRSSSTACLSRLQVPTLSRSIPRDGGSSSLPSFPWLPSALQSSPWQGLPMVHGNSKRSGRSIPSRSRSGLPLPL